MITPEEMAIADRRTEQKIFQFICVIKWLSEQCCQKSRVADVSPPASLKCYVRGSGLCTGVTGRKARFTFHMTDIYKIRDISINIRGPRHDLYCERIVNMLNLPSNTTMSNITKNVTKGETKDTTHQIPSRVASTEHVHGYLDDGFGNIFLRVKEFDRTTNGTFNTNTISFSCQCNGLGTFLFTFIPVFAGIHTISIKTGTQHVGESPYKVKIYQPCDLKQRTTNDANDKLFILDSLSMGSLDEHIKDTEATSQHENGVKIIGNGNGKSPRKSERLRLKRQFTIRKKRVLRKVVTKNGEEISILDSPSVPSLSRDTSINTDSDLTEDEAKGILGNIYCRNKRNSLDVTKRRSGNGTKTEDGQTYLSEGVQALQNRTKSEIQHQKNVTSSSSKKFVKLDENLKSNVKKNQGIPVKCIKSGGDTLQITHERHCCERDNSNVLSMESLHLNKKGNELSNSEYDSSISDSQSHLYIYEDLSSQDNVISQVENFESSESTCGILKIHDYSKLLRQMSDDNSDVFHNASQSTYTAPSTSASERTSSTGEDVVSAFSNFSVFFHGLDDISSSSFSTKGDNPDTIQSLDKDSEAIIDESVSAAAAHHNSDIVPTNPIAPTTLSTNLVSRYTDSAEKYRSCITSKKSAAASFRSAFSKPGLCNGKTFDYSDLTRDSYSSRHNTHEDRIEDLSPCIPGTSLEDTGGISGHTRYLQHWLDNQPLPEYVAAEQTTNTVTSRCDNTSLSQIPHATTSSDSQNGDGIDLPCGDKAVELTHSRQMPIPSIGFLGASTSDAVSPCLPKAWDKVQGLEWRDGKSEEIGRRKSDTEIGNHPQNVTLMMFRTLPSFESAVCLPSTMNIVVPTPHREKCTQVSADEIIKATGSTLRMSCFRLIRKRVCIKINSEEDISTGTHLEKYADTSNYIRQRTQDTDDQDLRISRASPPQLRVTHNEMDLHGLQNTDRKAIRQSTTETVDSGIADENSKPPSVVPSSVTVDTRRTFLSGHKLVYRRPYKGIIHIDQKLIRSNSTPDSSKDGEGRFYTTSRSLSKASESNVSDDLADCVVTQRKHLRHLKRGQAFSLSDPELHLAGISGFKSRYPSFMKTIQQIGFSHRFIGNGNKSDKDDVTNQESGDVGNDERFIGENMYGNDRLGIEERACIRKSDSKVGSNNEGVVSLTSGNRRYNFSESREYWGSNELGHTMDTRFDDINNSDLHNNLNKSNFDSFSPRAESLDDSYCMFGISEDSQRKFLPAIGDFQNGSIKEKSNRIPHHITFSNDDCTAEESETAANAFFPSLEHMNMVGHVTYDQIDGQREYSSEDNYRGFGINGQDRTDLLQNLKGFKNLENVADEMHTISTALQINEAGESNQSDTPYRQRYVANLYHDARYVTLHPENRQIKTVAPTHYISSVNFEVKASAFNCVSMFYCPPRYPSLSVEDTGPVQSSDMRYACDISSTGLCYMFDMKEELQSMPDVNHQTGCTNTDQLQVDGIGLTLGQVGVKNNFQIWAASDVTGCPTVSIYGPYPHCVTETCVIYTGDGLYEVIYEVTHPGYYIINVKWRDLELQESLCKITY
ncbi:uncharacterized protein LOC117315946 [Pecten maximus]|uniref:uncharacterized protein LOC117315946 n=1 Tax=Pecten maximus TaxID=6579 RepID=UPI001458D32B|nr:uncharacterized protein LOC117315946 [Pecten maximus]